MSKTRTTPLQIEQKTTRLDNKETYPLSITGLDSANVVYGVDKTGYIAVGGLKVLSATVGTSETAVEHGLGRVPNIVIPVAVSTTAVYVCMTKAPDDTKVYLIASAANTPVKVYVA